MEPGHTTLPQPLLLPSGQERAPTQRQVDVVEKTVEQVRSGEPLNKGEILREAGYSEAVSLHPAKVFESPTVLAMFEKIGITDDFLGKAHMKLFNAQKPEHMIFPPFREVWEKEPDEEEFMGDQVENAEMKNGKTKPEGERMTDADIREFIKSVGGTLHQIVHGDMARHVYFRMPDTKALKDALDMMYQIRGTYAPKKIDKRIGVYSMKDLRAKAREKGIKIIDQK